MQRRLKLTAVDTKYPFSGYPILKNSDFYQIVCTAERDEQQIDIEKVQSICENQGKD